MRTESNHIVLDQVRLTLNLLRKSNVLNESSGGESSIPSRFKDLQNNIRYAPQDPLDPTEVLSPFLHILKSQNMAGPFIMAALDAIQTFISSSVLLDIEDKAISAVSDIVDCVTKCKFVHTDSLVDSKVQTSIIRTIHLLILNTTKNYISNATAWNIYEFCFSILKTTGTLNGVVRRQSDQYEASERTVIDLTHYMMTKNPPSQPNLSPETRLAEDEDTSPLGLACLMKFFHYCVDAIRSHTAEPTLHHRKSTNVTGTPTSTPKAPASPSPLQKQLQVVPPSLIADPSLPVDVMHLVFVLKTLRSTLLASGVPAVVRKLVISSKDFADMITNELCHGLLMLSNTRNPTHPPIVLQLLLSLFTSLLNCVGPCMRIALECFMRQIYMKALIQTEATLSSQLKLTNTQESVPFASPSPGVSGKSAKTSIASGSSTEVASMLDDFQPDELEVVVESLCDLLADVALVPAMFASFDCDPAKVDIVRPLIQCISRCCCLVLKYGTEVMTGPCREIGILLIQGFKQIMKTFSSRNASRETFMEKLGRGNEDPLNLETLEAKRSVFISRMFKAARISKSLFAEASRLFSEKPAKGLRFLQEKGALTSPLEPQAVAMFLRLAPGLPKENVGSYLGELGKDNPPFEGDGKEFHKQVLEKYVESFELEGLNVLNCLRIFLSAFRLPGEAQQIDRILVAFSEYCHKHAVDGRDGTLENSEITYLLTFSIIMLNTDRHNANIRDDRRMTKDQFVRNNTNYGKDLNQTVPLKREYLEGIFDSINDLAIRTEGDDMSANITSEVWMDLQLQAFADYKKAMLISVNHHPGFLMNLAELYKDQGEDGIDPMNSTSQASENKTSIAFISAKMLHSKTGASSLYDPLELSSDVQGMTWLFDEDLLNCVWKDILLVSVCVYWHNFEVMRKKLYDAEEGAADSSGLPLKEKTGRLLHLSNELLTNLLKITDSYQLNFVLNAAILLLLEFSGMTKGDISDQILTCLRAESTELALSVDLSGIDSDLVLYQLQHFSSARNSLTLLLQVIHTYQSSIKNWAVIWYFLGMLRDCTLLPFEMVVEAEADVLPVNARRDFEGLLLHMDEKLLQRLRPDIPVRTPRPSPSLLSLQGLGEALFGPGEGDEGDEEGSAYETGSGAKMSGHPEEAIEDSLEFKLNAPSARWDIGYEWAASIKPAAAIAQEVKNQAQAEVHHISVHAALPPSGRVLLHTSSNGNINQRVVSIEDLRASIAKSNIAQLITDTRFLSEADLALFMKALVCVVEIKGCQAGVELGAWDSESSTLMQDYPHAVKTYKEAVESSPEKSTSDVDLTVFDRNEKIRSGMRALMVQMQKALLTQSTVSSASVAWLEMILVEVSLRNRDRFGAFWSALKHHFIRSLSGNTVELNYITERRVLGLMKVSTRMLSRDHYAGTILELLGKLLVCPPAIRSASFDEEEDDLVNPMQKTGASQTSSSFPPMRQELLDNLSSQIAGGLWTLLTLNVELLPLLPLEQWQTLFRIIAVSASSGSFAAIKSFEVMAWLLHEPRLFAKVPVFCIIGVRPLLINQAAPLSVAVGAVHLLSHLHSRLEVLIKDDEDDGDDFDDYDGPDLEGDTPVLWESCWAPILRSFAEAAGDGREALREAAVDALAAALNDRHAQAVPPGVLVNILGDIVASMIISLGKRLVEDVMKALNSKKNGRPPAGPKKNGGKPLQHQWVNIKPSYIQADADSNESGDLDGPEPEVETGAPDAKSVMERGLEALSQAFSRHMKKLVSYPAFDKLWLRTLLVFSSVLGTQPENDAGYSISHFYRSQSDELPSETAKTMRNIIITAKVQIRELLGVLTREKTLKNRQGLFSVTKETVQSFEDGEALISEFFSSG